MAAWDDVIPEIDKKVMVKSGHILKSGFGKNPAVLVIDATYNFVGLDKPILESIETYSNSIGEQAWRCVANIQTLLNTARTLGSPVFYTTCHCNPSEAAFDSFARKKRSDSTEGPRGREIVDELSPIPDEVVLQKRYASAFFGTPLISFLHGAGIDTVILTGFVTGGCVRATAVDAHAYNLKVVVVEDCVADRMEISHKVSLMDIDMKYGDVIRLDEVIEFLQGLKQSPCVDSTN